MCQNITLHTVNIKYTCSVKFKIMDLSMNSCSWVAMYVPHPTFFPLQVSKPKRGLKVEGSPRAPLSASDSTRSLF